MAKKTNFKNPAEMFISSAQEEDKTKTLDAEELIELSLKLPRGYVIKRESKTRRMQILVRPSLRDGVAKAAEEIGISVNDLMNRIMEEYLERRENG